MTRYNRQETEALLVSAVGELIETKGFGAVGVNAVARQAGVDKVLLYRYFDDLDGLLAVYAERADLWPTVDEILAPGVEELADARPSEVAWRILTNIASGIRRRPLAIELLAWECNNRNALTIALEEVRERRNTEMLTRLRGAGDFDPELTIAGSVISASINYFALRGRNIRIFGGLDIRSDEGWQTMFAVWRRMLSGFDR